MIRLNPDREIVTRVQEALKESDGYCPCATIRNEDTKCMCKDFRENVSSGECHCGLYVKEKD